MYKKINYKSSSLRLIHVLAFAILFFVQFQEKFISASNYYGPNNVSHVAIANQNHATHFNDSKEIRLKPNKHFTFSDSHFLFSTFQITKPEIAVITTENIFKQVFTFNNFHLHSSLRGPPALA